MLSEALSKALSEQVNSEYYSAYLYQAMSAYADRAGFKGVANWLSVQAKEEMAHGGHMYEHILERGGSLSFDDVKAPPSSYKSIREVFEKVLAHEIHVTERINKIASLSIQENDHATYNFILWYVNEQVEEEKNAQDIIAKIAIMGDNTGLIYHLDMELAGRTFTDPFSAAAADTASG
ncbi:MAG: ferritin [Treponema sp.]|jgi:ferritin|nr:ferritin [Treponema sp.]